MTYYLNKNFVKLEKNFSGSDSSLVRRREISIIIINNNNSDKAIVEKLSTYVCATYGESN